MCVLYTVCCVLRVVSCAACRVACAVRCLLSAVCRIAMCSGLRAAWCMPYCCTPHAAVRAARRVLPSARCARRVVWCCGRCAVCCVPRAAQRVRCAGAPHRARRAVCGVGCVVCAALHGRAPPALPCGACDVRCGAPCTRARGAYRWRRGRHADPESRAALKRSDANQGLCSPAQVSPLPTRRATRCRVTGNGRAFPNPLGQ